MLLEGIAVELNKIRLSHDQIPILADEIFHRLEKAIHPLKVQGGQLAQNGTQ